MTLSTLEFERPIRDLEDKREQLLQLAQEHGIDVARELDSLNSKLADLKRTVYANLTPWQSVQLARHPSRPQTQDYINRIITDWQELHGDRHFADDEAMITGLGKLEGRKIAVIGQQKGQDAIERVRRNFGMPHPEGYRKALRVMKLAGRFGIPILCLIDTAGAYPGVGAEERHVAEAIAVNLREMFTLPVPIVAVVIGEGGSGGALGIGVADRVLMLQYAYYSVISPEGCAAILWKDRAFAPDAAAALKMTAPDLLKLGVADEIVPEPLEGAHRDPDATAQEVQQAVARCFNQLSEYSPEQLQATRYEHFRRMGKFSVKSQPAAEDKPQGVEDKGVH
ncbi:MAG TPA: acetyl-CoA carboxylase carboxyl transferase subunit alpha [Verrucomicrobia bacterium]|jgi:acetyl-CoA carboxylase carboxyl transferase subunit alpha|nr:acetyl-CoA carboxylase carboxyl transferase subunit alpha [Verrucomicrobiota bacterium]